MASNLRTQCATRVSKSMREDGTKLTDRQIRDVIDELYGLAGDKNPTVGRAGNQIGRLARELTEREQIALAVEKRQRAINILRRERLMGKIAQIEGQRRATIRGGQTYRYTDALEILDVGSIRKGDEFALSLEATGAAYETVFMGRLAADLGTIPEVRAAWRGTRWLGKVDAAMERRWAQEMSRQNGGPDVETKDRIAQQGGMIINKHIEALRLQLNAAGAMISKRDAFIIAQSHDAPRIAQAGKEQWISDIEGKLADSTFEQAGINPADVAARREWLGDVWTNLASGNHLKDVPADGGIPGFKGPGNLAKRLSQSRKLHFKDGGQWYDYHEKYGHGSLFEGVMQQIQRGARNVAVLETYGANPGALRDSIIDRLILQAKDAGDAEQVQALSRAKNYNSIEAARFRSASGIHNVADPTWARRSSNTRAILNMSSLGASLLTNFSDLAANMSVLRHNGYSVLGAIGTSLSNLGPLSGDKRAFAEVMGAGIDGILGDVHARMGANDMLPTKMSRLQSAFFKLNGMQWWQDRLSAGMSLSLSRNMAMQLEHAWNAIPRRLQTNLQRYGIGPEDWTKLQAVSTRLDDTGERYLMTDAIDDADLARKMTVYYSDQTREGMTMPGARERAWSEMFGDRGTAGGEAARFILQFKSFTMAYTNKHLGRELYRDGVDFANLAFLGVFTTALGYLSMTAKDMLKGRNPRDPNEAKTYLDAMAQGGFGGIFGDMLLTEYDTQGGPAAALSGPLLGKISDFVLALNNARNAIVSDDKTLSQNYTKNAVFGTLNSMPLANLIGFRQALDWMVLYQASEWLAPGSLRRSEQNLRKRTGQEMFISPARAVPYGGGDRIGEGLR